MKKLFVICLAFISFSSFANLDGKWTGWGEWKFQGSGASCYTFLDFSESNQKLTRHETEFDCQVAVLHILEETWIKQGEDLLVDNKIVGQVQGNHYSMKEDYNDHVTIKTDINVEGNHLDYKEIWYDRDQELYVITGRLFRKVN